MARTLPEILRRFRPVAAPGPAGPAGVPVDRVAEAEAELAVVFEALAPTVAEARRLGDAARSDADLLRRHAAEEAQRAVAEARSRLDAVRADAATARLAELDDERAPLQRAATAEAERVERVADDRVAALVEDVIARVRRTAGLGPSPETAGAGGEASR